MFKMKCFAAGLVVASILMLPGKVRAQESGIDSATGDTLTLSQALQWAMEENHGIRMARNTAGIDANRATPGYAGYLPRLNLVGSVERSVLDKRIEFGNQLPVKEKDQAISTRYNSALVLSYTLFDGFGNRYRLNSLRTEEKLSSVETRLRVEQTLLNVIDSYLRVIGQQRLLDISREAVELSDERYRRVQKQYKMGGRSKVDLLNAEVALNQDSTRHIQSQADLRQAKRDLLVLLGQSPAGEITIQPEFEIDRSLELARIRQQAQKENVTITADRLEIRQAKLNLKQSRAEQYPSLNLEFLYGYTRAEDEVSIQSFQSSDGFSGGLTLQFNLFNGFRRSIEKQNAQLRLENSRERHEQTGKEISRNILNTWEQYETNLLLLDRQRLNVKTAELNFRHTREAFRLGQATNSELREAQLNLLGAQQQFIEIKIRAKQTEIRLLQLSGQLTGRVE